MRDAQRELWTRQLATHAHLEVVKWLHENRSEGCSTAAIEGAARNGYLDVVKWLSVNLQKHFSSRAIVCAATEGHLKVVRWLVGNDTERLHVVEAMIEAISHGHFEIALFQHAQNRNGYSDEEVRSLTSATHEEKSFEAIRNWCDVNLRASATPL